MNVTDSTPISSHCCHAVSSTRLTRFFSARLRDINNIIGSGTGSEWDRDREWEQEWERVNIPSLRFLWITFPLHFLLLVFKHCFFLCIQAFKNPLDGWQSVLEPSRRTCGHILDT